MPEIERGREKTRQAKYMVCFLCGPKVLYITAASLLEGLHGKFPVRPRKDVRAMQGNTAFHFDRHSDEIIHFLLSLACL